MRHALGLGSRMSHTPSAFAAQPPAAAGDPAQAEAPSPEAGAVSPLPLPAGHRGLSLALLAGFGALFVLHWSSAVFVPLMLGLTLSYALTPTVARLQQLRLFRATSSPLG